MRRSALLCTVLAALAPLPAPAQPAGPAVERREQTVVAVDAGRPTEEAARAAAINDVLRDLEASAGAEPGTVAHHRSQFADFLDFDVAKASRAMRNAVGAKTFSAAGGAVVSGAARSSVVAAVEYHSNASPAGSEQVVAVGANQGATIAGRAFKSGTAPVTLQMATAGLTASQVAAAAPGDAPPVKVTVGTQSRVLAAGETARFGDLEVEVESSVDLSARPAAQREGPPYGLSLRVRPAGP